MNTHGLINGKPKAIKDRPELSSKIMLSKQEIIIDIKRHWKVSHILFEKNEYVYAFNDFAIFTEEGLSFDYDNFWSERSDKAFDQGWFEVT